MSKIINRFSWLFLIGIVLFSCTPTKKIIAEPVTDISYLIPGKNFSSLGIDNLGNIFLVKNSRILQKYNHNGQLDKTFDDQSGGFIHSIDVNNPLYILIYFKDASKVTLLDRNLAVLNELDIAKWTQNDITAASLSNDNRIWLYDNTERKLKKYSIHGKLILESTDLYGMSGVNTFVEQLLEHENRVYMRNQAGQLIIVDNLGGYIGDKDFATSLPLYPRKGQICCPMFDKYNCIRLDDNPFQQVIGIETLDPAHKESILFKLQLFQLTNGGLLKSDLKVAK